MIRRRHKRSLTRFIVRLSIGATALSVAVLICATAFVNGFQHAIENKIYSFWGHIRVIQSVEAGTGMMEEMPVDKSNEVEKQLKEMKEVESAYAFATKSALLQYAGTLESVLFKGVENESAFDKKAQFLQEGKWISFKSETYSNEIVISTTTAGQLMLHAGDNLIVHFFRDDGSKTARKLQVCGVYKTGIEEFDRNFGICDLKLIQRLNQWPENRIAGYELRLREQKDLQQTNQKIYEKLPQGWYSKTTREVYPNIFDWLNLQEQIKELLYIIMIVIAVMNLVTCLIILVLDRIRMTAILSSAGADTLLIQKIFLWNSTYIALQGIIWGTLAGLILCFAQNATGLIQLDEEAYYLNVARADVNFWEVLSIDIATLFICTICLWLPTYLIRRFKPIQAIRKF
jgi:lipoprotein-releasing system permease protein